MARVAPLLGPRKRLAPSARNALLGSLAWWLVGCATTAGGAAPASPAAGGATGPATGRLDEAAAQWANRSDDAALQRALQLWTARLQDAPADALAAQALVRGLFFAGSREQGVSPQRAREHHEQGQSIAAAALARLHPQGAPPTGAPLAGGLGALPDAALELLYWSALNQLHAARLSGLPRRAFDTPRVREALEHCRRLRPGLDHGGPDRTLGGLYAEPPDASLRDLPRSKEHFEAALQLDASYPDNHRSYARDYAVAAQDWSAFTSQLRAALDPAAAVPADAQPEAALARASAEQLLQQGTNIFE
jgi:hypothetical protein